MAQEPCITVNGVLTCLSAHDAVGLAIGVESAFLSLVAVSIILVLICRNVWRKTLFPPTPSERQHLFQVPADVFMLSLFVADLLQALGGVVNVKWIHELRVYRGGFCSAQGTIQQLGEPAVALVTLVIAVHTFSSVWWGRGLKSLFVAWVIIGLVWLFVILFLVIEIGTNANDLSSYYTPTPYWCWIHDGNKLRIGAEYLWFWVTLVISLAFYVPLFFWSRGNITVDQDKWFSFKVHRSKDSAEHSERRRHSLTLIAYPIIYSASIIPQTVVRFIEWAHPNHFPGGPVFFSETVYRLSGLLNVLLFVMTRRTLLLFGNNSSMPNHGQAPASADDLNADEAQKDMIPMGRLPSHDSGI